MFISKFCFITTSLCGSTQMCSCEVDLQFQRAETRITNLGMAVVKGTVER